MFETTDGPGIVSFITASSYLNGPGFLGMREVIRQVFDELWIIDLEGGTLGARKTENVFAIQTPVAIAIGVRYGGPNPDTPATGRYAKITGSREEKLAKLDSVQSFDDLDWQECSNDWTAALIPARRSDFSSWPLLTDLFPWQHPGVKAGRTWPIAVTRDVATERWQRLASSSPSSRSGLFADRRFGRGSATRPSEGMWPPPASPQTIQDITSNSPIPPVGRYVHRSFDRKWILADGRLFRTPSQPLWYAHSEKQIYLISLLTGVLGYGPAAVVAALVPDLHHFNGRGGKDIIPLWRNAAGTEANITTGLLDHLAQVYGGSVSPEDLFAYCYAILAGLEYTPRFSEDLATSSPRISLTTDVNLFRQGVTLGRRLIWLHTYGARFVPEGEQDGTVPAGRARAVRSVPVTTEGYPNDFHWDEATETLHVGEGTFAPISRAVWEFEVSGLRPVKSWLGYRMREPAGRKSSPLDEVRPREWPAEFTEELLELLWVLEHTIDMASDLATFFEAVIQGDVLTAEDLPTPAENQRKAPEIPRVNDAAPPGQMAFDE